MTSRPVVSREGGEIPNPHETLVTIIVTHYDYSHIIADALASVAKQSHTQFECIVVDDCSSLKHRTALRSIMEKCSDTRFKLIELAENKGQTNAIFEGLRKSSGEFVALLDPDDLYTPDFLKKMLKCHLNPVLYAAVAACDMGLYRVGGSVLTHNYVGFRHESIKNGTYPRHEASLLDYGFSTYYEPETVGWLWATTSSLMFRRDALEALRRTEYMPNLKICGDTYCAIGCHMLGGTLFLDEVLSWRGLHAANAVETSWLVSSEQRKHQPSFEDTSRKIRYFAMQTLLENRTASYLPSRTLGRVLRAHFTGEEFKQLMADNPEFSRLALE